jgi:hypothetical protein
LNKLSGGDVWIYRIQMDKTDRIFINPAVHFRRRIADDSDTKWHCCAIEVGAEHADYSTDLRGRDPGITLVETLERKDNDMVRG